MMAKRNVLDPKAGRVTGGHWGGGVEYPPGN